MATASGKSSCHRGHGQPPRSILPTTTNTLSMATKMSEPASLLHINPRQGGGGGGGNQQAQSSSSSIPATAPAGGLTITQPPQTATSFYKIAPSQPITFAWNFTYLLATPTSLTISAVGDNGNTYPVGPTNGIIPGTSTSVVWDPYSYNQNSGGQVRKFYFPVLLEVTDVFSCSQHL